MKYWRTHKSKGRNLPELTRPCETPTKGQRKNEPERWRIFHRKLLLDFFTFCSARRKLFSAPFCESFRTKSGLNGERKDLFSAHNALGTPQYAWLDEERRAVQWAPIKTNCVCGPCITKKSQSRMAIKRNLLVCPGKIDFSDEKCAYSWRKGVEFFCLFVWLAFFLPPILICYTHTYEGVSHLLPGAVYPCTSRHEQERFSTSPFHARKSLAFFSLCLPRAPTSFASSCIDYSAQKRTNSSFLGWKWTRLIKCVFIHLIRRNVPKYITSSLSNAPFSLSFLQSWSQEERKNRDGEKSA